MKRFASRAGYLILALSLAGSSTLVFADAYPSTPKGVLAKYLQLDSEAAGLSPTTWGELSTYTTWTQAPTWENFMVIDRYEVGQQMSGSTRARISVTYYPLGKLSDTFQASTQPEAVYYYLAKVKGVWRVDTPQLIPHVVWPVMRKRLEEGSAKNPAVKKTNDALIAQIDAVKAGLK